MLWLIIIYHWLSLPPPIPHFIFPLCGDLSEVSRWQPLTETAEGALSPSVNQLSAAAETLKRKVQPI